MGGLGPPMGGLGPPTPGTPGQLPGLKIKTTSVWTVLEKILSSNKK
jgi:hypothetical protein